MKVFIYGQYWKADDAPHVNGLITQLKSHGADLCIYQPYLEKAHLASNNHTIASNYDDLKAFAPDVFITLGGDGTILSAIGLIRDLEIPIMGINLGRLGFLASIEQERISMAVEQLANKKYTVTRRTMLKMNSSPEIFPEQGFALNDLTLLKRDNSSMVVVRAYIDGLFLCSYWADGLIVSTATGSTGYSLSCGGPIIFPISENLILTPVAPHNLSVRPVIVPGNSEISLKIEGRAENFLCALDGRNALVTSDHEIKISKCEFVTQTISLEGDDFMKTIRNKLNWGLDKRNYEGKD